MSSNNLGPSFPRAQRPDIFTQNQNPGIGHYNLPSYYHVIGASFGVKSQYQMVDGQLFYQNEQNTFPGPGSYNFDKQSKNKNNGSKFQQSQHQVIVQYSQEINKNAFNQDKEVFL